MKRTLTTILALAVIFSVTLTGLVGMAAAHDVGDRDTIIHTNTTASDDVAEVWVDVAGAQNISTADNTTTARVVIQGVNGSNTTELLNQTLNITEGNVSSAAYQTVENDSSDYEDFHIAVTTANGSSQYIDADTTEWGTLNENVGGGGGSLPGGTVAGIPILLVVLGGGYWLMKED